MRRICLFLVCTLAGWALAGAWSQAGDNPILTLAKEKVADPKKSFTMAVILTVKEGAGKQLEELFAPAIKATRKEKGCIAYDLNRDLEKANTYIVYERWQSLAALENHMQTEHIKTLLGKIGDVAAGNPEVKFFAIAGE